MTATVNNQTLSTDVYYPIVAPTPTVSQSPPAQSTEVSTDTAGANPTCGAPLSSFMAIHLGVPCAQSPSPSPSPGISSPFSVTVPPYGTGQIGVAQLMQLTFSGTKNSQQVQYTTGDMNHKVLDTQFPYFNKTYSAGSETELFVDSPYYDLDASQCGSPIAYNENFSDYFMYKPDLNGRLGGSIWVTLEIQNWSWGGMATKSKSGWGLASNPKAVSPGTVTATRSTPLPAWNAWFQSTTALPC